MKNKIFVCIGFVACFGIGFICGMYAQSRIIRGQNDAKRQDLIELFDGTSSQKTESAVKCLDGAFPDKNGCCTGEVYTDMGDLGFNCCPTSGGDCFPPIPMGK